jgi:hypothetical protein
MENGEIVDSAISEREISYMRLHKTLELPATFVRKVRLETDHASTVYPKSIVFEGFQLSITHPNNVCLMRNGDVVICTDIRANGPDDYEPRIYGCKFKKVVPAFCEAASGDSRDIGYFKVSQIMYDDPKEWPCNMLLSKCFISPVPKFYDVTNKVPLPKIMQKRVSDIPADVLSSFFAKCSFSQWYVHSIEIPDYL